MYHVRCAMWIRVPVQINSFCKILREICRVFLLIYVWSNTNFKLTTSEFVFLWTLFLFQSNHFSPEKNRNQELKPNSELKYPESEENNKYKSQGFISGSEDTNFTTPEGYEENTTPLIITIPKESQEVETTTHFLFFW